MKKTSFLLVASVMLLSACNSSSDNEFEVVDVDASAIQEQKPTLHTEIKTESDKYFLHVDTDLIVSKEKYGAEKINGQGHIHVYVNDGEKQGVTEFPFEIKELKNGLNQIKVSLHNNDHTPYGVSKTIEIEINK